MSWNYRIVRRLVEDGVNKEPQPWFGVHEAYYDKNGQITNITEKPVAVEGESVEELNGVRAMMFAATKHPVLDYETMQPVEP